MHWRLSIAAIVVCAALLWLCPSQAGAADTPPPADAAPADAAAAPPPAATADSAEKAETGDAKAEKAEKKWYRGAVSAGFDGLWGSGGEKDLELKQSLQFQIDPPQCERLHLRGSIWTIETLGSGPAANSGLSDLNNTYDAAVIVRPSHLYLDVDDLWGDSTLRIGRQRIAEGTAYNRIDGVYFKQRLNMWDWYVFGGSRATFYGDNFHDPVGGGGVSFSPMPTTKIALDAYAGRDSREIGHDRTLHGPIAAFLYSRNERDISSQLDDVSVGLSVWQTINENLSLFGRFNTYDSQGNEFLLSATGYFADPADLTYEVTYRHQFNQIQDRVNDLTAYYQILDTSETYNDFLIALHRPITKNTMVSIETEFHNSDQNDWSNRDYQRYALLLSGEKLFGPAALDGKIGVERWNAGGGEGTWAFVGEVGRQWDKLKVTLGTDYQRYQDYLTAYNQPLLLLDMARVWFAPGILQGYNPLTYFYGKYQVQTHENIYSIYLKAKWAVTPDQDLQGRVMYEKDDGPWSPVWRVQADYTVRF
jgi:hypothetical protein